MNGKNAVTLIGYVGNNLKSSTHNGIARTSLRIATHHYYMSQSGEKINQTTWHLVIAWEQVAMFADRNFVKGSKIMVEGSVVYENYMGKDGIKKFTAYIKAISLSNLDR